jgi:hypothetical protein
LDEGNDAGLLAILVDQPDFTPGDLVIEPEFIVCGDVAVLQ